MANLKKRPDFRLLFFALFFAAVIVPGALEKIRCPIQSLYQFGDSFSDKGNDVHIVGPLSPPYGITFPGYPIGRPSDGRLIVDYTGAPQKKKCPIQSLYQFGDSFSDTGNFIRIFPNNPATRLPYGKTYPGYPTGRSSDGRLIIDYIAMAFRLPLLNPNLDSTASFDNGVNYAVGASRVLNNSFYLARGIPIQLVPSLSDQLTSFKTHLNSICSTPRDCADKLRKALIFVGEIGFNDIFVSILARRPLEEIRAYIPLVVETITNTTREVIKAGCSQVVVPGVFPNGCTPLARSVFSSNNSTQYDNFGCVKSANNLSISLNSQLEEALDSLRKKFPNAVILYADFYNAYQTLLRKASTFGFNTTTLLKPCCGDTNNLCGSPGATVCPDPNTHIHWDSVHLTQEASRLVSEIIIKDLKLKCVLHQNSKYEI